MIDPAAATFERFAAEYDFGRPSWPAEAVASVGLPRDADVADLGAGTGKLTRALLGQFDHVVAIEPLDGMRALIPSEATVLAGTAEAIPLPDGSIDGVFCGESFHWFDWPHALPEIGRVLRPGGHLAMLWNRGEASWPAAVEEILERVSDSPGEKRYHAYAWRDAFEASVFEPLRHEVFPARAGRRPRRSGRPDRLVEQLHDPTCGGAGGAPGGDPRRPDRAVVPRPPGDPRLDDATSPVLGPGDARQGWIAAGSTTSKSEPLTRPSVCRSSLSQCGSGAPLMYQFDPLSATIIP